MSTSIPAALAFLGCTGLAMAQGLGIGRGPIAETWQNQCASCHGDRGQGGNANSLLAGDYETDGSNRALFDATKKGMPNFGMPAYGETLSDEEIWGLTVLIREFQEQHRLQQGKYAKPADGGIYRSQHHAYKVEEVIEGGVEVPWSVDWLPDGRMLITERDGRLRIFSDGRLSDPVSGLPSIRARGQGGLMDVAVHPDHAKNGWVYLAFSDPGQRGAMTKVVRGKLDGSAWTAQETIFEAKPEHYLTTFLHFGCRIVFSQPDDEGRRYVYFGIGERGAAEHAQDLSRPNGKIHRLWDDGKVPADNPFVGESNAYPSIFTYGNRNPQGLAMDADGNLWETEHGPRGGDEVNIIEKGRNYGWPLVSYGINYQGTPLTVPFPDVKGVEDKNIKMPVDIWLPAVGACGLDIAKGDAFPKWSGDLVAGGLSGQNVDRFKIKREGDSWVVVEREELLFRQGRVRDVATGPDGCIYVVLNGPDKVIRLAPADSAAGR